MRLLEARAARHADCDRARLVSTYFDTPDHELAQKGLVLRVRERDGRYVQTVKSVDLGGAGALTRGEWEDVVDEPWPDPQAPDSGRLLPAGMAARLAPLFRTEIVRRAIALAPTSRTHIEAAIDQGTIVAPGCDAAEPISEVELELKRGDVAALYDVALELLAVAPVRLERSSKPARGYRLIAPEATPAVAVHATPVELQPGLSGHEALQRITRACLGQIQQNEAAVLAGLPDGIHQMRVGLRRLRAALAAFAPMLPGGQRRWASAELRRLGLALSAARNVDVFLDGLVEPARQGLDDPPGLGPLIAAAKARRKASYAEAAAAVGGISYTGLLLRLLRWCDSYGWRGQASRALDRTIADMALHILDRRLAVARRDAVGFENQSPEQRHELRLALKKLRYAAEMLGGLYDAEALGHFLRPVKQLQDDLGEANDLRVGHEIVAELARDNGAAAIAEAGALVLRWHEQRLIERAPRMVRRVARLAEIEPFWSR